MSLSALAHVMYEVRGIDPTAKLVLLAIADHIHSETGWAWPSTTRLADLAGVSKRSVIRHLDTLEAAGLLEVDRRTGRSSGYRIIIQKHPETSDTHVTTPPGTSDTSVTSPVTPTSPLTGDAHDTSPNEPVTPVTQSGDAGVTQTVKNQEEEDEEDTDGVSAARLADRVSIITQITPDTWTGQPVLCDDPRLTATLDDLTGAGWTTDTLRQACSTLPKPRTNPTSLLASHLKHLRERSPNALATTGRRHDQSTASCNHGIPAFAKCRDCDHPSEGDN